MSAIASEDDANSDQDILYTNNRRANSAANIALKQRRHNGSSASLRDRDKAERLISTNPLIRGAGETETEGDEPIARLPTARKIHSPSPVFEEKVMPVLYEIARQTSVLPALAGSVWNTSRIIWPPISSETPSSSVALRMDYTLSLLFSLLTLYQSLSLATGLFHRWKLYYTPLPTLIRLIALQGICWPALYWTLKIGQVDKRPVMVWAVVGTTTSFSRSIQIWVTSNLWDPADVGKTGKSSKSGRWGGGPWKNRRWDWKEVSMECLLPLGLIYFVVAWGELIRREITGC